MILMLNIHYTRAPDIVRPDHLVTLPSLPISAYRDSFGNWCSRIVAPAGVTRISTDARSTTGLPDVVAPRPADAGRIAAQETLIFLLGSRYCDTERPTAGRMAALRQRSTGWSRPGHLRLR